MSQKEITVQEKSEEPVQVVNELTGMINHNGFRPAGSFMTNFRIANLATAA